MPELPDVEVYRRRVESQALGKRVEGMEVEEGRILEGVSRRALRSAVRGRRLAGTRRHGKHLFLALDGRGEIGAARRWLRLHFGMTGEILHWKGAPAGDADDPPRHVRLRLDLDGDEHLAYRNVRQLGAVGLLEDPEVFVREQELGPDPLEDDLDLETFRGRLGGRRGALKPVLVNQTVLAGLGNLYVDEILFQAGLHPESKVADLEDGDLERLHRTLGRVLRRAVEDQADAARMPRTWLLPNREEGARCPRCHGTIRKIRVAGRSTYHCDRHQERRG